MALLDEGGSVSHRLNRPTDADCETIDQEHENRSAQQAEEEQGAVQFSDRCQGFVDWLPQDDTPSQVC